MSNPLYSYIPPTPSVQMVRVRGIVNNGEELIKSWVSTYILSWGISFSINKEWIIDGGVVDDLLHIDHASNHLQSHRYKQFLQIGNGSLCDQFPFSSGTTLHRRLILDHRQVADLDDLVLKIRLLFSHKS